jgi:hypothetical protein
MEGQVSSQPTKGNSSLAVFGGRDQIREMAERLRTMMPGTTNLTAGEALTVAQIAVAHQLDPFNGEVWGLKGDNGKWYGVMVGIKGLRKAARNQAVGEGGSFWTEFRRVEPGAYNVSRAGAVVYECYLRDTVHVQAWARSIHELTGVGVPYAQAVEALGPAPHVKGVGIAYADERSKMEIHARARKRAEADAIKQRYDLQFAGAAINIDDDDDQEPGDVVIGEYREAANVPSIAPRRSETEILTDLGFSGQGEPEYVDPDPAQPETADETPASLYADLDFQAQADPSTAFWSLAKRTGTDKATADAIVKECSRDMARAYQALRKQIPDN